MTIDEIVEKALPLRGIECPTKKAECVIKRRELKNDIAQLIREIDFQRHVKPYY